MHFFAKTIVVGLSLANSIICPTHGLPSFFENDIFISCIRRKEKVNSGKIVKLLIIHVNEYPFNSFIRSYNCNGHA